MAMSRAMLKQTSDASLCSTDSMKFENLIAIDLKRNVAIILQFFCASKVLLLLQMVRLQ